MAMNIFRKLGNGLSKLSLHKKDSSKSKSKAKRCEAKPDGLTYNSPFGASFRRNPDPDLSCSSFVSPETSANRTLEASAEDFDGLEGSISSFDRPFLEQANKDDLGHGSQPTKLDFKTVYLKSVDARNGRDPERESRKGKSSRVVIKGSESIELESLSCSRKSQTVDVNSQQMIRNSPESFDLEFDNSSDRKNKTGEKFQPKDPSKIRNLNPEKRTSASFISNLVDTNLDSLKSSIEEIIDSGLQFESSYAVGFEPATEHTPCDQSNLDIRHPVGNTSIQKHSAGHSHDLQGIHDWNNANVDSCSVRKPMSVQSDNLENTLGLPDFPDDAREKSMNAFVSKRGSLRRRSSSLSEIDRHQRYISFLSSRRGTDLATNSDLDIHQTTLKSRGDEQPGCEQNVVLEGSVGRMVTLKGKGPSELLIKRLAAIMCPRPYGFRNTVNKNDSASMDIIFSDRMPSPCSGEVSEPVISCTAREPKLYTMSSSPVAISPDSVCGNELRQLSYSESPRKNSSTVNKQISVFDTVESSTSVIFSRASGERTEQPFQPATNFQDSAQIKSSDVSQTICTPIARERCIVAKPGLSEPNPISSASGGNFERQSLSKSVHQNVIQQTATPGDILWKRSDLEEIKSSDTSKLASVQHIHNDDPQFVMPPPESSVAMTYLRPPSHDPLLSRFEQASATQENTFKLERPFTYSSCIFYTKEAILRQSRKGWSTRCDEDSD